MMSIAMLHNMNNKCKVRRGARVRKEEKDEKGKKRSARGFYREAGLEYTQQYEWRVAKSCCCCCCWSRNMLNSSAQVRA